MSGPVPFAGRNPNLNPFPQMNTLLENLLNGNLKDAKEQAKRFELFKIAGAAMALGYSRNKAIMAAAYLKGRATFQAYCDAV